MFLLAGLHCLLPADQLSIFFTCSRLFPPQDVDENTETLFIQVELSQLQLKPFFLHLVQQGLIFLSLQLRNTREDQTTDGDVVLYLSKSHMIANRYAVKTMNKC